MSISNCVILVIGEVIIDVCLFITCFDPEVIFLDKIPTIGAIILMIGSIIYSHFGKLLLMVYILRSRS